MIREIHQETGTRQPSGSNESVALIATFRWPNRIGAALAAPTAAKSGYLPPYSEHVAEVYMTAVGIVSRVTPVHTVLRNCTRDEGGPFEVGNQVLISSHRKLLLSKAMVVNVAEKSKRDFGRYD